MRISSQYLRILTCSAFVGVAVFWGCHLKPSGNKLFIPGKSAGELQIGVDDTNAVKRKIGEPEFRAPFRENGALWMYPSMGLSLQFKGKKSLYTPVLTPDTTIVKILLLQQQEINDKKYSACTLQSPEGITVNSSVADVIRKYGQPLVIQAPIGMNLENDNYTGSLYYPGMAAIYSQGKMKWIELAYSPSMDSNIARKVDDQPIVAGKTLGGISLGMSHDDVLNLLGDTKFKYQKLNAEYWLYPQYALKVQFGVQPIEGQRTQRFTDTSYLGKVTGITGTAKSFFEGELCCTEYTGKTADGIGVGTSWSTVQEKFGPSIDTIKVSTEVGILRAVYNGIVIYVDPQTQGVHHILVTDPNIPIDVDLPR